MEWFQLTHAIEYGFGWAQWRRTALPVAGGLSEQPAKLMAQLAYVADLKNTVIAEQLRRPRRQRERHNEAEHRG